MKPSGGPEGTASKREKRSAGSAGRDSDSSRSARAEPAGAANRRHPKGLGHSLGEVSQARCRVVSCRVWWCLAADERFRAMNNTAPDPPVQLLTRPQVESLTGLSCSSLYRAMRRDEFPEPLRISHRSVRWRTDEIQAWINGRPRASGNSRGAT